MSFIAYIVLPLGPVKTKNKENKKKKNKKRETSF